MVPAPSYLPSLDRARREGVRALARRWWRGGEATDLLADDPDETHRLAAMIVGRGAGRSIRIPAHAPRILGTAVHALLAHHREDPPEALRVPHAREAGPFRTAAIESGWAWPFVWLRYTGLGAPRDVALVVAPDGALRAIVAPLTR
jgi:hypothetical protein